MRATNLNKIGQLSRKDRRLLIQSVLLLPVIHFALLLLGYYPLRGVMEKLIPLKSISIRVSETEALQRAQEVARIVSIAAQHGLYKGTCLRRALLAWWLLQREGIQTQICFGVRVSNRKLEAHAWVEYHGSVVNDPANVHGRYKALKDDLPRTYSGL